ncbi:U11/U12 small nuclear ribonucleoprotein 25 kDa protein isoform X2 [Mirounga angustirostris]|uniref:U11/U12 small nuclear ribonucleoprotein 25 kDa protein isoform X1 n=1 Tax=Mirounga leonina TaxID=9715 RepID=UPI00156BE6C0|nr:U11/U12 small nuclear ribonucleoprotein 25 kDa protein isoform X1 [Mirounga leonina]
MVVQDPLLCDLPIQVTLEEVNSQIALEYGQAMTVRVCKMDGEIMPVVVVQNATVLDLKKAIQRYVQLRQEREGGIQHISCPCPSCPVTVLVVYLNPHLSLAGPMCGGPTT